MKLRLVHRAARAAATVIALPPSSEDTRWALGGLSQPEAQLFAAMNAADRRHAISVARRVQTILDRDLPSLDAHERELVLRCALLHDVGKTIAGLGVWGRTVATLTGWIAGQDFGEVYQQQSGFTRRVGLYLRYGELGAEQLELAGSPTWVVAWSREHHLDSSEWSLPIQVGKALAAADG